MTFQGFSLFKSRPKFEDVKKDFDILAQLNIFVAISPAGTDSLL
jgi:hypothetical protein